MPRIRLFVSLVFLLPMLALLPARAADELTAAFTNNTRLEIYAIAMKVGRGGMTASMHIVPGNTMTMSMGGGGAPQLSAVTLDMGVARFAFADLSALAGQTDLKLNLSLDDAGEPWLETEGSRPVRMSGKAVALIREGEHAVPLERIMEAKSMADIRALPGVTACEDDDERLSAQVLFAGSLWIGNVESGEREGFSSDPAKIGLGPVILRAPFEAGTMEALLQVLHNMNFRPWFMQFKAGRDMDTERMAKFPQEYPNREEAQAAMAALFAGRSADRPSSIDGLLLPGALYEAALSGALPDTVPVFRVHCSNADVLEIIFHPNGRILVDMTR